MTAADAVIAHLCSARALLIMDNCEHVCADAAALVDMIIASCPGVSVLATSRQAVDVEGEVTWRVPPMSLPAEIGATGIEGLTGSEAVQLFAERASRARPGFCLDDRNQEAVARICRSLDGIPLAIELAAARVRVLTPAQIAEGLHERFRLLTGSVRTAMPRQQTLEASLDWSYSLLTELERVVFRRLGVFAGSFDLESATAVCAGSEIDPWHVLDLITLLVDKSLVSVDDSDEVARYRLLETMRLYALNCIRAAEEETPARDRHRTHYLQLVEAATPHLQGAGSRLWLGRLDTEYPDLQAALTWSQQTGDADVLCRLVAGLVPFWVYGSRGLHSQAGEATKWADAALTQSTPVPLPLRATLLWGKATFATWASDLATAAAVAQEGLAIARQIGDDRLIGRCLIPLGQARSLFEDTEEICEEAITVSRRAGDTFALGQALLGSIGVDFWRRPQLVQMRAEEALAMTNEIDEQARGVMLAGYGYLIAVTGRPREGLQILESAREYAYQIGFVPAIMSAETLGALVYAACDNHEAALATAQRVEEMGARLGMRRDTHASQTKALVAAAQGELEQALRHSEVALQSAPGSLWQTNAISVAAQVALAAGDLTTARAHVDKLADLSASEGYVISAAEADLLDSRIQRRQGHRDIAEHAAHRALSQSEELPAWTITVDALEVLAGLAADAESYEEAGRLLGSARQLRDTTGYQLCITERDTDLAHVRDNLGPEHFDTLYAEGRDLSLDQAASYARRGRGERKRPTTGWESLTPTETQITTLLVDGLKNAEIGHRMFVSPRTVQTHLTRIYTKLGVTGRTELAAKAAQRYANRSTGPGPQK
jgi:predicted ATPase/DNA-binding CsgD family transcriptional regulator